MKWTLIFFFVMTSSVFASDPELLIGDQTTSAPEIGYDLFLGVPLPKDPPNCAGLGSYHLQKFPAPGSRILVHNTSSSILLLYTYIAIEEHVSRGGSFIRYVGPTNTASVRLLKDEDLGLPTDVYGKMTLVLHAGDTVEVKVPSPLHVDDTVTSFSLKCQSLAAFKKRPKFSYGTMAVFDSSL